ncbi:FAD-dependent oxidoreductase [Pedobacter xixiisoli]|uniref:FAD dependent oxidoreductase n=1 Tax=Pedobacter xixiisoli TaxID=1476464 RepID=A0A286ADP6_9SPHI|nr:FAD-dependent oxidoreductase [Pedobacter xixiisoli]SOD20003.1 FAD dependent oxidoreductase [Pedobacter xixiisoli]
MKRYLFLFSAFFFSFQLKAQTIKPDVFVVGNGNAAVAAAIQAAQSNVKTILLLQSGGFDIEPIGKDLHSGVQAAFIKKLKAFQKQPDSIPDVKFDKQAANEVLTKWTDSIKNLTVIKNVVWAKADRSGKGWVFKLSDGKTIRPEVFINVADQKLNVALKIDASASTTWNKFDYQNSIYKTNIATGKNIDGSTNSIYSLYQLLMPTQENLVYVNDASSMLLGQSAGVIAAYAGFFNLKTSESNLKKIQGELIAFNTNLMPFADVGVKDANWKAVQMVGLTGVLKAEEVNGKLLFNAEKLVSTADIRQPIKDHYYKAQIWFDDHKSEIITIGAAIDMICYVGNKAPETTKKEVEKKWKTTYAFTSDLNLERQISKREFATLLQDYMPPFNVTIDKTGKILR